jgi:hypothetical protein
MKHYCTITTEVYFYNDISEMRKHREEMESKGWRVDGWDENGLQAFYEIEVKH